VWVFWRPPSGRCIEGPVERQIDEPTMGELLGLLAHDLRNPLSALHSNIGYIGSCLGTQNEELREAVQDTITSCDGLAVIIDNIEVLSRGIQGRALAKIPVSVIQSVSEVIARSQSMAASHGVCIELVTVGGNEIRVLSNPEMLGYAIRNLLRNGIQHSPSGQTIRVSIRRSEAEALLLFEDSGIGIAPPLRETAFTAQGQVEAKSNAAGRYGRGLGLLCAKLAADAAGVRVAAVDPPNGNGCAFSLVAPLA
jgi:signal transduction histidine kinase